MSVLGGLDNRFGSEVTALETTTPLGGNGVFTSQWLNVSGVSALRVGAFTDQAGDLFTEHSDDGGVTIMRSSDQPVTANKGEFLSFHPRSNYFRVRYVNGASAQTFLHISVEASAVIPGITQSLVSATLGRTSLAAQVRAMAYDYKYDSHVSIMPSSRDMLVAQRVSLFADAFLGPVDTTNWTTTVVGSGTATITVQKLNLSTGITANSTVDFKSNPLGRFVAGNIQGFKAGIETPDVGTANNVRRWGAYDANNGYFFELNGTTLNAVGRIAGVDTKVAAASWSSDKSFVLAPGDIHSFEISYFADVAYFIIDDEVRHIMIGGGFKGSFPNHFENNNSGGSTTNVTFFVRGTNQQRYGPNQTSPLGKNIAGASTTTLKIGPGNLQRVIVNNAAVNSTITIYDNTSAAGTKLATLTTAAAGNGPPVSLAYGIDFYLGLTVVTSAAANDITVVFD